MDLRTLACLPLLSPVTLLSPAEFVHADGSPPDDEAMIELAWESGCFNCHDVDERVRGPAWRAVARRYRDDPEAFERLVATVISGGSGNWGDDAMTANRRVPEADVRTLVQWLLALE
jgi:cytochrome c